MTEEALHRSILAYLRAVLPHGWRCIHIPNAPRSKQAGWRLKQMGMLAGMPDLMILGAIGHNLQPWVGFIEIKTPKVGKRRAGQLSEAQSAVHDWLTDMGFPVRVCRSIDDTRAALRAWELPTNEVVL